MSEVAVRKASNGWIVTERSERSLGPFVDTVYTDELVMLEAVWRRVSNPRSGVPAPWIRERDDSPMSEGDQFAAMRYTLRERDERIAELESLVKERDERIAELELLDDEEG